MGNKRMVPLVDLSTFVEGDAAEKAAFVKAIGDAFHNIGFVGVVNHGIDKSLIDNFYSILLLISHCQYLLYSVFLNFSLGYLL